MKRFFKGGVPLIWLSGGALAFSLLMVGGLVLLVMRNGLGFFWPSKIVHVKLNDGTEYLGQVVEREKIPQPGAPPGIKDRFRIKLRIGNRDLYGFDFLWVDEDQIEKTDQPKEAVLFERKEWGNLYGFIKEIRVGDQVVAQGPKEGWDALKSRLPEAQALAKEIKRIEQKEIGAINYRMEQARLAVKKLELWGEMDSAKVEALHRRIQQEQEEYQKVVAQLVGLSQKASREQIVISAMGGQEKVLPLMSVVRASRPNAMGFFPKLGLYLSKLWEFLSGDPRESNTEGGSSRLSLGRS